MGKRFIKFRVSRVIPSFQSCRSKDASSLPANPVPSFPRLPPATDTHKLNHRPRSPPSQPPPPPPAQSNSKHRHSSLKRHVSSALLSARRSFLGSRSSREGSHTESPSHFQIQWDNYNNYHYTPPRRKIYNSAASENNENEHDVVFFPPLSLNNRRPRRRSTRRRRRSFQKIRLSTSSDSGMIFSEDEDGEETDTLVSTEDSTPSRRSNAAGKVKKHKRSRRWSSVQHSQEVAEDESPSPARLSEFMRKMVPCRAVEGKVRESFAVVKRSADPYEDFKKSMAEMVVEKQMFQAADLEDLLHCFLSLNSDHHHEAIVRAFTEIWEALFSQSSS